MFWLRNKKNNFQFHTLTKYLGACVRSFILYYFRLISRTNISVKNVTSHSRFYGNLRDTDAFILVSNLTHVKSAQSPSGVTHFYTAIKHAMRQNNIPAWSVMHTLNVLTV